MLKLIITIMLLVAVAFSLSIYKNKTITTEFKKELNSIKALDHKDVSCDGFFKSDCSIEKPMYGGKLIAEELIIKDIDPTSIPTNNEFKEVPLKIDIIDMKYSIWDLLSNQESSEALKEFFKKYKGDYDISAKLSINTDANTIKNIKIHDLVADDKFVPFQLNAEVDGLDSAIIVKSLNTTLDFSKKRAIFDDFVDSMKKCCIDKFPPEYKNMSNDELYHKFISKLRENDLGLKALNSAISVLSDEQKSRLELNINAKTNTPISKMMLPFLMGGTSVVEQFYDIKVGAK